jgi:hypothetical protein
VACSASRDQVRPTLQTIVDSISSSNLNQFAVLKMPPGDDGICTFGDFSFGRLNLNRLDHVCEQAGSDYFRRYHANLTNCTATMRIVKNVRLIDLKGSRLMLREYKQEQRDLSYRLLDDYHSDIANEYWEKFRFDMIRQQALMTAAGVGGISPNVFWQLQRLAMFVAIFTRELPDRGWVSPQTTCVHLNQTKPSVIEQGREEVSALLRISDWDTSVLDDSIQLFSDYVAASSEHEAEGRIEEALLHSVFALDLLLGGKADEALTVVLAERAGFLCYLPLEMKLDESIKFIRDTYDMRSGYAHRGQRGKLSSRKSGLGLHDRYELLRKSCRAILIAACWARRQPWCQGRDSWLARIDLLRARHRAGDSTSCEISQLGLDRIHVSQSNISGFMIDWGQPE